ncbi:MAG: hypothetical protein HUJ25_02515 [Crocinitomicaceae bacterium]|nr:hypothetical protein [Crocinitomicaceae bacterium]
MEGFRKIDNNQFEYRSKGRLVIFTVEGNNIHFEDGPENPTARGHEGMGGVQSIQEFKKRPYAWIYDYPGLHVEICKHL